MSSLRNSLRTQPFVRRISARMFDLTGQNVGTRWYSHYKEDQIQSALGRFFDAERVPDGFGLHLDERIVEYPWFFSRLADTPGRLLDAGSVLNFDYLLEREKLKNKDITIMTLAPESNCYCEKRVSYVFGDLRQTCFRDEYFDSICCLSTLEHVGLDNTLFYTNDASKQEEERSAYAPAVQELHRVLRRGGTCFVTVPFGRAQSRGWLQIFNREMVDAVVDAFCPAQFYSTYFKYSAKNGWQKSSREEASDARYFDVHFDDPWPECPAAAGAIVCLELTK